MFVTSSIARAVVATTGAILFAATCLLGAVAPAAAHEADVRTQTVSYADLDLQRPADRARLEARIRAAARAVCSLNTTSDFARSAEYRCTKRAVATATAALS
ncbi:UrcA family protein [Glacieibacterium sp.]|uniref:UrcA family protein n=1 Tax=Glacieibacterium sp. TaxID=2860237 RepID=UPI003AFFB010